MGNMELAMWKYVLAWILRIDTLKRKLLENQW